MPRFLWLDDEQLIQDRVFEGVPRRVRDLFDQVSRLECGLPLLRLLGAQMKKLMSLDDIAYQLEEPRVAVEGGLDAMVEMGLVRRVDLASHVFFGITSDHDQRQIVHDLLAWQDLWHARLARIERMIDGKAHRRRSVKRL